MAIQLANGISWPVLLASEKAKPLPISNDEANGQKKPDKWSKLLLVDVFNDNV